MQDGQRAGGQGQPDAERDQALDLVPGGVRAAGDAECHAPVGGGVRDRGHQQADHVGGLGRHVPAEQQEQQDVGERAGHPDDREPRDLQRKFARAGRPGPGAAGRGTRTTKQGNLDGSPGEANAEPEHPAQVSQGGGDDVNA